MTQEERIAELEKQLKDEQQKVVKLVVYSEQIEHKARTLEKVERDLREFCEAYCNRDEGHRDDFSHPAWTRFQLAMKACVALGEKLPEPPFTVEIEKEEDGRWLANCTWKPGAMAYGPTMRDAAIAAIVQALPAPEKEWVDKPLPEDEAIRAAHPTVTRKYGIYQEAVRMVGAKYSKYALVDLVNWLLYRIEQKGKG